ncbi:MAG TPA: hypothetical protein VGD55_14605, partial [Acidothermaceae bacterium]
DGSSRKREELDLVRMTKVRNYFFEQPWGSSERFQIVDGSESQLEVTAQVLRLLKEFDPR